MESKNRGLSSKQVDGDCPQDLNKLSHVDENGNAKMVDVSLKNDSLRKARSSCVLIMKKETLDLIYEGKVKKGDVLTTAKVAAIMAAKKTDQLIPMCHPLNITGVEVTFNRLSDNDLEVICEVSLEGKTGVEMEALTATSIAALTIYDMVKAVEKGIKITDLKLLEKSGGKSGHWKA